MTNGITPEAAARIDAAAQRFVDAVENSVLIAMDNHREIVERYRVLLTKLHPGWRDVAERASDEWAARTPEAWDRLLLRRAEDETRSTEAYRRWAEMVDPLPVEAWTDIPLATIDGVHSANIEAVLQAAEGVRLTLPPDRIAEQVDAVLDAHRRFLDQHFLCHRNPIGVAHALLPPKSGMFPVVHADTHQDERDLRDTLLDLKRRANALKDVAEREHGRGPLPPVCLVCNLLEDFRAWEAVESEHGRQMRRAFPEKEEQAVELQRRLFHHPAVRRLMACYGPDDCHDEATVRRLIQEVALHAPPGEDHIDAILHMTIGEFVDNLKTIRDPVARPTPAASPADADAEPKVDVKPAEAEPVLSDMQQRLLLAMLDLGATHVNGRRALEEIGNHASNAHQDRASYRRPMNKLKNELQLVAVAGTGPDSGHYLTTAGVAQARRFAALRNGGAMGAP